MHAAMQNTSKMFFRVLSNQLKQNTQNKHFLLSFDKENRSIFFNQRFMGTWKSSGLDDIKEVPKKDADKKKVKSLVLVKAEDTTDECKTFLDQMRIFSHYLVSDQWGSYKPKQIKTYTEFDQLISSTQLSTYMHDHPVAGSSSEISVLDDLWQLPPKKDISYRINEAPKVLTSATTYVPEAYQTLNPLQKKLESKADYQKFMQEYKQLKKEGVHIQQITYKVDGQDVVGFVLLPKERIDGKKHPLVMSFRGGFNGRDMFHEWAKIDLPWLMRHYAFLAKNGYAVMVSQYRNADGNTNKDEFGGADVNDVMALFDVASEIGTVDLTDICLNAFSRGTVMLGQTLARLKNERPNIYKNIKAAIIKGGISDLETFMHKDPKYIKPILEQARDDFKSRKDEILREISLVRKPEVLQHIPTLVMHNEQDNVVPASLSRNLVKQLEQQGVEHEVKFFLGKHHQILEFNNEVHQLSLDWLQKNRAN